MLTILFFMHLCLVYIFSKMNYKKIVTPEFVLAGAHSNQLAITLKHYVNVTDVLYKWLFFSFQARLYLSIPLEVRMTT